MTLVAAHTILTVFVGLLIAWLGYRDLSLLLMRRPVVAQIISRTYIEHEQLRDRAAHPWDRIRNADPDSIQAVVADVLRVRYEVDGKEYRQDVETWNLRGERAEGAPLLWYDPRDPNRITTEQILPWPMWIVAVGLLGALVVGLI